MIAMASVEADIAAAALDAFRARDADALWALMDPEAEFRSVTGGEASSYRGRQGVDRYFADIAEVFEGWHTEDERHLEAPDGRVVSVYRVVGEGRGSGVPIDLEMGIVWTLRDHCLLLGEVHMTG